VERSREPSPTRQDPNNYRLWGLIAGGLFAVLMALNLLLAKGIPTQPHELTDFLQVAFAEAVVCGVIGWVFQALAVVFGLRPPNPFLDEQAQDFDDVPDGPALRDPTDKKT